MDPESTAEMFPKCPIIINDCNSIKHLFLKNIPLAPPNPFIFYSLIYQKQRKGKEKKQNIRLPNTSWSETMISSMKNHPSISVAAAGASTSTWCKRTEEFLGRSLRNSELYRQSLQRLMHMNFQLKEKYIFVFITWIYVRGLLKRKFTIFNDRKVS